ncbi:MAG: hypothetical protein ABI780_01390 [Ardenticatenales bacterium]
MMDDLERTMHASDGSADVGADTDETYARAVLGAHPWPRFGEALKARLMAIPTTAPQASSGASRESRRIPTHDTGPQSVPRDARRRRREAWAMAVVVAVVAGLAIALAGTATVRQGRPVGMGPSSYPATAITDVLKGRLIYARNDRGDGRFTMYALQMRDGTTERLFDGPVITATDSLWSVSPDGSRIAIARTEGSDDTRGVIYVGALTKDAPQPEAVAAPQMVAGIQWASDSRSIYYGLPTYAEPSTVKELTLANFEIHHLTLADAFGPNGHGSGDQVVVRLEGANSGADGVAELIGVDGEGRHMAVSTAFQDANGYSGEILLLGLNDGRLDHRIDTDGMAIGINHMLTPSRRAISFLWCTTCDDRDPGEIRRVDMASGAMATLFRGVATDMGKPAIWSPDERWMVSQGATGIGTDPIRALDLDEQPAREFPVEGSSGLAILFAPGTSTLLTSAGQLVDLAAVARGEPAVATIPWPLPNGFSWDDGPILAWLPDTPLVHRMPTASLPDSEQPSLPLQTDVPVLIVPIGPRTSRDRPTPTPTPTSDIVFSAAKVTPVATVFAAPNRADSGAAPRLNIGEWSPDSRWLPFWTAERDEVLNPSAGSAQLNFYDNITGHVCAQSGVQRRSRADDVFWSEDGRAIVRVDAEPAIGDPCRALAPAPSSTYALPTARAGETPTWATINAGDEPSDPPGDEPSSPSPDGGFVVTTRALADGAHYQTFITCAADKVHVVDVTWPSWPSPEWIGLGGEWMPNGSFLIPYTFDRGPLVLDPAGTVDTAARKLFGLSIPPTDGTGVSAGVVHARTGTDWHVFLTGAGNVRLFHSETGRAETLSASDLWGTGTSADGRWLMLQDDDGLSVRAIDDVGAPPRRIPASRGVSPYKAPQSPDGSRIVFPERDTGRIAIVSIPEGRVIGHWLLDRYVSGIPRWSPDGTTIAIDGEIQSQDGDVTTRALFILPLGPKP